MNNKNPKISVIIPVYNTSTYLCECLNSILDQDFDENYEVICVNDGSTDNSLEILRQYEKKFSKIKVVDKINTGVAITRNIGLQNAKGDFIAFLDSDDFITRNYLSKLYNTAIKTNSDVVICNFYKYYEQTNFAKPIFFKFRRGEFDKYQILKGLIPDNLIHSYLWNKLWKREIFDDLNVFPDMKFEDLAILSKLIYKANKITVIGDTLYYYRIRKNSIVRNICIQTQNDYMKAYGFIRLFLKENNLYNKFKRQYFYLSLKTYIVMLAVIFLLLKEHLSLKMFFKNIYSVQCFMKLCSSDDFNLTKEDIINYNVISKGASYNLLKNTPK